MIGHEPDNTPGQTTRRTFFQWVTYGLSAVAAVATSMSVELKASRTR